MPAPSSPAPGTLRHPEIADLVLAAQQGDHQALATLRARLNEASWAQLGDLAANAEQLSLLAFAKDNAVVHQAVSKRLVALRAELTRATASTPLENLLVERITASWLQVQLFENHYAQNAGTLSFAQAEHFQRRLNHAHKRYLTAIRSLASCRATAPPARRRPSEHWRTTGQCHGRREQRPV